MRIETAFDFGEKVMIKDHGITGVINAFYYCRSNASFSYEIEYLDAKKQIQTRYFAEAELSKVKKPAKKRK